MRVLIMCLISLLMMNVTAEEQPFSVVLADDVWDGVEVPVGQQCEKFGGQGSTPSLSLSNIPKGTNAIVMAYSDRSYQAMDQGGHGKFAYQLGEKVNAVKIPSLAGHSFQLPANFYLIEAHRAPTWDRAGAYLPPCSGGKGNEYYLTVRAVKVVAGGIREVLAVVEVELGKY